MSDATNQSGRPADLVPFISCEPVWLELADGSRQLLGSTCSLGRSVGNDVQLADDRISRRHALIQLQGRQDYYVSDLGSANGTFINDRRLKQQTRLCHGDRVTIGDTWFRFHQPCSPPPLRHEPLTMGLPPGDDHTRACWLLLAEVEGSTEQVRQLAPARIPLLMQQWFDGGRQIVEATGGCLNQYTGDGFLAGWIDRPGTASRVALAIRELQARQTHLEPLFRLVLHFGDVEPDAADLPGGEELCGAAVNFTFRMRKLAGSLRRPSLLSAPARAKLGNHLPVTDAGVHEVTSFPGPFLFYELG